MDHRERMKHTVEKERSPPDKARMSLKAALFPSPGCTLNESMGVGGAETGIIRFFTKRMSFIRKNRFTVKNNKRELKSFSHVEMTSIPLKILQ